MPSKYVPKGKTVPARFEPGFMKRLDGRMELVKGLQKAYEDIVEDCGGADDQTHLRLALIERAVFLEFWLRQIERKVLTGEAKDDAISRWIQGTNSLTGLSKTLGLTKTAIDQSLDSLYSVSSSPQTAPNEKKPKPPKQKPKTKPKPSKSPKKKVDPDDDEW